MTREEAIESLKSIIDTYEMLEEKQVNSDVPLDGEDIQALGMAISALSAEPCDDCISRNDVIKMLNTMDRYTADKLKLCDTDKEFPHNEVFIVDDVYEELDLLPSVQPKKGEWIPVSERLPDNNVRVLCSAISTSISGGCTRFVGCCNNGYWFVQTDADTVSYPRQYKVIAWMPLLEPYKAE